MRGMWLIVVLVCVVGCHQKMAIQPSYRPQSKSDFFADGQSSRPPVPGTVARGQLSMRTDLARQQGKDDKGAWVREVPFALSEDILKRGQQRYNVFCSVCHGLTGAGDGRIVQRGFTKPPSLILDLSRGYKLRQEDIKLTDIGVGYIFDVISRGYGAMPGHAEQIPVNDRWAIVAYVRALQYSQLPALRDQLGKEKAK